MIQTVETEFAGRKLILETGRMGLQADGALVITYGESVVFCSAMMAQEGKDGADFFPLTMEYQERYYASGKIKGSRFVKREGRASDDGILKSRLMDRPIRPLFPKGITNEVQGIATVLSADLENDTGIMAINGMSVTMLIAGMPFAGPVAAVRVGMKDGQLIMNPTLQEAKEGDLDLVVAGTMDAINMVEAGASEISDEKMLEALNFAHEGIKKLCAFQMQLVEKVNPAPRGYAVSKPKDEYLELLGQVISQADLDTYKGTRKGEIKAAVHALEDKVSAHFAADIEAETHEERALMEALQKLLDKNMRRNILEKDLRLDGRRLDEVRPLSASVGVLPRTHGSALFQRGETQALTITTLGAPGDSQIIDTMEVDTEKRYIHYYSFPPFSTGEIKPLRGASRREIGHGALAERALERMIPSKEDFPYTILLVSEILTCNGSSSMASVCGSTLSLMDAGVPIKKPVSAVAMGLVTSDEFRESGTGAYKILTDIQSFEDFAGDMDFKVARTKDGITALQMDIKVKGITAAMMAEALSKAKVACEEILATMLAALPEARTQVSKYAPLILKIQIDPDKIRDVIGKGGETIQKITAECDVEIDIEQSGLVMITAPNGEAGAKAQRWIKQLTYEPEVGDEFEGEVVNIMDFGAFVEFIPGRDGLVHISNLRPFRVNKVTDVVQVGDKVKVRLIKVDEQGRYNLSMKEYYQGREGVNKTPSAPVAPSEPLDDGAF